MAMLNNQMVFSNLRVWLVVFCRIFPDNQVNGAPKFLWMRIPNILGGFLSHQIPLNPIKPYEFP